MEKRIAIPSSLKNIRNAVDEITGFLRSVKADEAAIFDIRLSLEEALINAIKYGNKQNENLTVDVDFACSGDKAVIAVEDKGEGFDHKQIPDPTDEENLLKARGRGVFLVKHIMDDVSYNKKGNRVSMTKFLKKKKRA